MTHLDDLYEPEDDRDWTLDELAEREPDEPEQEPPVNLDEVAELLQKVENATVRDEQEAAERELIEKAVPQMIDEIGDLRLRIAEFEALPTREEWAVTGSREEAPDPANRSVWGGTAEKAADYAAKHGAQMWRRMVSEHPVEPVDLDAPF